MLVIERTTCQCPINVRQVQEVSYYRASPIAADPSHTSTATFSSLLPKPVAFETCLAYNLVAYPFSFLNNDSNLIAVT